MTGTIKRSEIRAKVRSTRGRYFGATILKENGEQREMWIAWRNAERTAHRDLDGLETVWDVHEGRKPPEERRGRSPWRTLKHANVALLRIDGEDLEVIDE